MWFLWPKGTPEGGAGFTGALDHRKDYENRDAISERASVCLMLR